MFPRRCDAEEGFLGKNRRLRIFFKLVTINGDLGGNGQWRRAQQLLGLLPAALQKQGIISVKA
jgi:hypothetical protein